VIHTYQNLYKFDYNNGVEVFGGNLKRKEYDDLSLLMSRDGNKKTTAFETVVFNLNKILFNFLLF
jgi:hypothetical protein